MNLTPQEIAELSAFADGTISPERRADVEARVEASPELQELVERQRRSVAATHALARDEPSPALRAAVGVRGPRRGRPRTLRLAAAGVLAIVAAVVAAVVLSGGPGAPTVADAARLAAEPPTGPAPRAAGTRLAVGVEGVAFPDYARAYGWRPLGVRHGSVDGRNATVVYYGKDGRRLAYAIVAGDGLPRPTGGQTDVRRAVRYQAVRLNDRLVVTWRRGGHTCVLIGDASRAELLKLASWPLS